MIASPIEIVRSPELRASLQQLLAVADPWARVVTGFEVVALVSAWFALFSAWFSTPRPQPCDSPS